MKKISIFAFLILLFCSFCFAEQTTAYFKDGKIIVEDSKGRKRVSAYSKDKNRSIYNLKRWRIETDNSQSEEALEVFEDKARPKYSRKVWIINKKDNTQSTLIEYTSNQEEKIIFSPNEDFVYFLDLSDTGLGIVYGLNLLTNEKFVVSSGVDFDMITCPSNKTSYIVVKKDVGYQTIYNIYSQDREHKETLTGVISLEDIEKYFCY